MSDSPEPASPRGNKTTVYLLGVVAALLVVIVAIVIAMQQNKTVAQDPLTNTQSSTTTTAAGSMPGVGQSTGAQFDPATATKVPSGESPGDYMKRYYQAILDKKWDEAFKMQPATSQQGGTVADFEQTQTGYGYKSFAVASENVQGDTAVVSVDLTLDSGPWNVVWAFEKHDGDWVVKERSKITMKQ